MNDKTTVILFRRLAIIFTVVALLTGTMLLLSWLQTISIDPLTSQQRELLQERLYNEQSNQQLKDEIRLMDLLARKAFFTSLWQVRSGGIALLIAALAAIIFFKLSFTFAKRLVTPEDTPGNVKAAKTESLTRMTTLAMLIALIAAGAVVALFSSLFLNGGMLTAIDRFSEAAETYPDNDTIAANWPSLRGPWSLGVASETDPPTDWNEDENRGIIWKSAVPLPGFNSPVIWGDALFLAGGSETIQQIYCYDLATGVLRWTFDITGIKRSPKTPPQVTDDTGYTAATMTTDGNRVYCITALGDLVALTMQGEKVWGQNIGVPDNHYGHSSSLLFYRDLLYVQYDHFISSSLRAYRTANGKLQWQTERPVDISWASPALVLWDDQVRILCNASPYAAAYDALTGEETWRVECMFGEVAPSPAFAANLAIFVNRYATLVAIDIVSGEIVWDVDGDLPEVSSPVATQEFVFLASATGALSCYDITDGNLLWIEEYSTGFYSSPVIAGNLLYVTDRSGKTIILEVAGTHREVAQCELSEPVVATPSFHQNRIYLRSESNIYCLGNPESEQLDE